MFLKDKASFNVDWLDGYHAANEANSIPVIGSDGKLPIAILPTGKGSTQVALGNHTHTATEVGARPNNWIPSKADIEGVLTGNITTHTHNNYVTTSDTSIVKGARKNWTSVSGATTDADSWCTLFTVGDSTNAPVLAMLRAYAHTSILFSVSVGYNSNNAIITIINANTSSNNAGYKYIKGLRIAEGGKVQVKLNKGSHTNIDCQIIGSSTNVSLSATLTNDTTTTSAQVRVTIDPIENGAMYVNNNKVYHTGYKPSLGDISKSSNSSMTIHADADASSTSEYLELKAGNNSLKVMSSASATGADKLLFNGSKVYHEGFKPVIDTIKVSDSRNVNSGPQTDLATPIVKFDFRSNTATGLSDGGSYSGVMGFRPYGSSSDWTGGPAFQLAFTNNNNLWLRKGTSDSWNSWKKVIFSDEVDTSNTVNKIVKRDASGNINVNGVNVGNTIRDTRITTGNTQVINAASSIVYVGNPATSLNLESSTNPTIKLGSTVYTIYHTGNKPTPADIGAATSSHTHNNIVSRGKVTCETGVSGRPAVTGLSMSEAYNNGYPTTYGNVINLRGQGDGQILVGWSGSDGAHAPVYVRSKRDNTNTANWSGWAQFYTTAHKPTAVDVGARPSSWIPSKADIEGQLTGTITTHTHNINTLKGAYSSGVPVTSQSAGDVKYYYNILNNATGCFPTNNNANGILQLNKHSGGYDSQLGFSSNGNIYYRSFNGKDPDTTTAWKQIAFTDSVMSNAESWKVTRKELDANTNLDNLEQSGHYISGSDGNSQTIVNRPPGDQGFALEVRVVWMNGSLPGRITQVAYMRKTNEIYMRSKDETTGWSSWTKSLIESDASTSNTANKIVKRDANGKISVGNLDVNGNITMVGSGRVIITSNNYGIKGYLSDGTSSDYLLYMGNDNRVKLSYNNRAIDVQGQMSLKAAQGTAPMTVVSTTKVGNLNADLLDDLHSSSFLRSDAANSTDVRLSSGDGRGLRFWDSDSYKIYMSSSGNGTWGGRMTGDTTSDYNIYFKISGNTNRGFVFKGTSGNIMGVDGNGDLRVKGSTSIGDNKVKMQYNSATESLDFIFN